VKAAKPSGKRPEVERTDNDVRRKREDVGTQIARITQIMRSEGRGKKEEG